MAETRTMKTADSTSLAPPSESTSPASPAESNSPTSTTSSPSPAPQVPHTGHPKIVKKMFVPTHPDVIEKDKSIHPEHGVIHYPWYYGGLASCVSTTCTQPFGVAGLGAALVRVSCYSGIRFGMYEKLKELSTTPTHSPSAYTLAGLAAASGATGSVFSNFADVVCLRIQNDPGLPTAQRRNYKGFAHGLAKMVSEEGLSSIWTGVGIGAGRAAVSTATQLAGYDIAKRELMRRTSMKDDPYTHVSASCLAGFLSTLICNPLDVLKARVMTRSNDTSIPVMLKHTFRTEGAIWMFRGMLPALLSRGPSTIITFVTFEQLKHAYRHAHGLGD